MNSKGSITALMSAFGRAYHTEKEEKPVFSDSKAKKLIEKEYSDIEKYILSGKDFFISEAEKNLSDREVVRYIVNNYIATTPLCRSAYTEHCLMNAIHTGTLQYVILGAGLDTSALNGAVSSSLDAVFELDAPATQTDKIRRIQESGIETPDNLRFVNIDFAHEDLREKLIDAGFDSGKKTLFTLLGVSYYLTAENLAHMFSSISEIMADGSGIIFDCGNSDMFSSDDRRVRNMISMAEAGGEPMKSAFSYHETEKILENYGMLIFDYLTPSDIQKRIIAQSGCDMKAFPCIDYVYAVKKCVYKQS